MNLRNYFISVRFCLSVVTTSVLSILFLFVALISGFRCNVDSWSYGLSLPGIVILDIF